MTENQPTFAALIHDVRGELNALLNMIELRRMDGELREDRALDFSSQVKVVLSRVAALVDAHQDEALTDELNLIVACGDYCRAMLSEGWDAQFVQAGAGTGMVHFNERDLKLVLDELVRNAKKGDARKICILVRCEEKITQMYFRDNGKGIDHAHLRCIGVNHSTSGGGQGINLIKQVVLRVQGDIHWYSELQRGVTVLMTLKTVQPRLCP